MKEKNIMKKPEKLTKEKAISNGSVRWQYALGLKGKSIKTSDLNSKKSLKDLWKKLESYSKIPCDLEKQSRKEK